MTLENRVFSDAKSAKIGQDHVAVRLLGGMDMTPAVQEFMERYEVEGYPTLLAMTPTGAVLGRDFPWPPSADGILEAMTGARRAEDEFQAKRKELAGSKEVASRTELAKLHLERFELDESKRLFLEVVAQTPTAEAYGLLAQVQGRLRDKAGERKTLETMVAKFPQDPERIEWRITLATMDLPKSATSEEEFQDVLAKHLQALGALLAEVQRAGTPSDQSEVRFRLADFAHQKQDFPAMKSHLDWIATNDAQGKWAPLARLRLAVTAYQQGDLETAVALLEKIVAEHPDTDAAEQAKSVLPDVKEELAAKKQGGVGELDEPKDADEGEEDTGPPQPR